MSLTGMCKFGPLALNPHPHQSCFLTPYTSKKGVVLLLETAFICLLKNGGKGYMHTLLH